MAKAPTPKAGGYDAAKARQERAKFVQKIQLLESDFSFFWRPWSIPVYVRSHVHDTTGKVVETLLYEGDAIDSSTYADMWWISRLAAGETVSRRDSAIEFDQKCPGAVPIDFKVTDVTEGDEAPEA